MSVIISRKAVGIRKLSELEIDIDKDWMDYGIENARYISVSRDYVDGILRKDEYTNGVALNLKYSRTIPHITASAGMDAMTWWEEIGGEEQYAGLCDVVIGAGKVKGSTHYNSGFLFTCNTAVGSSMGIFCEDAGITKMIQINAYFGEPLRILTDSFEIVPVAPANPPKITYRSKGEILELNNHENESIRQLVSIDDTSNYMRWVMPKLGSVDVGIRPTGDTTYIGIIGENPIVFCANGGDFGYVGIGLCKRTIEGVVEYLRINTLGIRHSLYPVNAIGPDPRGDGELVYSDEVIGESSIHRDTIYSVIEDVGGTLYKHVGTHSAYVTSSASEFSCGYSRYIWFKNTWTFQHGYGLDVAVTPDASELTMRNKYGMADNPTRTTTVKVDGLGSYFDASYSYFGHVGVAFMHVYDEYDIRIGISHTIPGLPEPTVRDFVFGIVSSPTGYAIKLTNTFDYLDMSDTRAMLPQVESDTEPVLQDKEVLFWHDTSTDTYWILWRFNGVTRKVQMT